MPFSAVQNQAAGVSPLYKLLSDYFPGFVASYDTKFSRSHGFFRPVISDVVHAYLKSGDLKQGFARVSCPDCHHEYLLAFSCRGRWFCPSCHAKKVIQFSEALRENILYPVPHRQYVFSIPIILRKFFLYIHYGAYRGSCGSRGSRTWL